MPKPVDYEQAQSRVKGECTFIVKQSYEGWNEPCLAVDDEYGFFSVVKCFYLAWKVHPERERQTKLLKLKGALHPLVSVKEESFVDLSSRCVFIDLERGEWVALPNNMLMRPGRRKP